MGWVGHLVELDIWLGMRCEWVGYLLGFMFDWDGDFVALCRDGDLVGFYWGLSFVGDYILLDIWVDCTFGRVLWRVWVGLVRSFVVFGCAGCEIWLGCRLDWVGDWLGWIRYYVGW